MKSHKTVILTDSKAALQTLIFNAPDQPIHQLLKDLQLLPHECTVALQWIPAHCGISGNERADRLGADNCNPCPPPLTRRPKPCSETDKDVNGEGPLETTTPLQTQSTNEQTTIFRLQTGHCSLRAHQKRIGITDSAFCHCKEAEQTVHHILQDCSIWLQQRQQLWPLDESTTNKLWGTAEDLRRTTQFLATCGLRV